MRCNVEYLKLVCRRYSDNPSSTQSKQRLILEMQIKTEDMDRRISPYLHSDYAVDHFVSSLRGEIPWTEKHGFMASFGIAFDDLGYCITSICPEGFDVWEFRSNGDCGKHYITFPGIELADRIQSMRPGYYGSSYEYEYPEQKLAALRKSFWPDVHIIWLPEALERYVAVMTGQVPLMDEKAKNELRTSLKHLWKIASNHSSGDAAEVRMRCDSVAHSFYFSIHTATGIRVLNGGIIAHPEREESDRPWHEREVIGYRYSTHT